MYENGFHILNINLSDNSIEKVKIDDEELLKRYLGGRGIATYLMLKDNEPDYDPYDENAPIIYASGTLSGTFVPSSGRLSVIFKSPATGKFFKSNGGGHFSSQLKFAGYDMIVVRGRAKKPVYIYIDNDLVEIRDASNVWGKDVREATKLLKEETGDLNTQVICIGPGGENKVAFASVNISVHNVAARGGGGAVMGDKNLKAITVRGTKSLRVVQPDRFSERVSVLFGKMKEAPGVEPLNLYGTSSSLMGTVESGSLPTKNFQTGYLDDAYNLTGQHLVEAGYLKKRVSCYSCPAACHRYCTVDEGQFKGAYTCGPEFETFSALGSGCCCTDTATVIKASELCNIYGLDVISAGSCIQWLMECKERGVVTDEDAGGLDLSWGNSLAIVELIRMMAFREGIGDLLAKGLKRASEELGHDSYKWAVQARGLEQSRVDTRNAFSYALAFAISSRGPDHLNTECLAEFGGDPVFERVIKKITGSEEYAHPYIMEKRPEIVKWHEEIYAVSDSLGICAFPTTAQYWTEEEDLAELYSSATGIEMSADEIMEAGRRILTMERLFNGMLGHTRKNDVLPYRLMNEQLTTTVPENKVRINNEEMLNELKDKYYDLVGWDIEKGLPKKETLKSLKLDEFIPKVENYVELP